MTTQISIKIIAIRGLPGDFLKKQKNKYLLIAAELDGRIQECDNLLIGDEVTCFHLRELSLFINFIVADYNTPTSKWYPELVFRIRSISQFKSPSTKVEN
jgi:hypothetical protein